MNPLHSSNEPLTSRRTSGQVEERRPQAPARRELPLSPTAPGMKVAVRGKSGKPDYAARERLVSVVFYALGILCLLLAGVVWWQLLRDLS